MDRCPTCKVWFCSCPSCNETFCEMCGMTEDELEEEMENEIETDESK